ncbi:MAG: response regulator [Rhodospirillaceae bacterium]|nr:response regulator [Rhodospirillaceae bacterium]
MKNQLTMDNEQKTAGAGWIDRAILFEVVLACFGGLFVSTVAFLQQRFIIGLDSVPVQNFIAPFVVGGLLAATVAFFVRQSRRHLLDRLKVERETAEFHRDAHDELEISHQAVIETVLDGIITIDEIGTILTFNPAAENIFEVESDEVIGRNVKILMPEPYTSEHDGYLKAFRETGETKIIGGGREVMGLRSDGTEFPLALAVSEVLTGDKRMFAGVVRDITDRKQAERQKNEFISTVSHELRTPLTSIKGSLGLIKSGVVGELPDQFKSMLDIAYKNSDRLVLLINDILDMEKIEAGMMNFNMVPLDLSELVSQSLEANKGFADEYNVTFAVTELSPATRVRGDGDRLMQVLSNLLSNAAKFSPIGAQVDISVKSNDGNYRVSVSDYGPGIPDEFKDQIFNKFSQADASDTRQKNGTGLGLSISKSFVEKHGGIIGFNTKAGEGTTFYFDLPKYEDSNLATMPVSNVTGKESRILICEDEPDIEKLLEYMLRQGGFDTALAINAEQAKELLATEKFDAMILDLILPGQDGISLIKELRQNPETRDLPILVISAKADKGRAELNGDAFGIIDWLEKPIDENVLTESLRNALQYSAESKPLILHIEDDSDVIHIVSAIVDDLADVTPAMTAKEAKQLLQERDFDLVILDLMLPDCQGEDLLPLLRRSDKSLIPVVVFSAREINGSVAENIQAALIKSQSSNEILMAAIRSSIEARRKP